MSKHKSELEAIWGEARRHIEDDELEKAIEIYKYVLIRYSEDKVAAEYAHAYLGDLYLTKRKLKEATQHLKKAIKIKPDNPKYRYLLGFVYSIQERWSLAVDELQYASDGEPDNPEFRRSLGWAVFNHGNHIMGLIYLREALDLAPDDVNILMDIATAYLMDTDIAQARNMESELSSRTRGMTLHKG